MPSLVKAAAAALVPIALALASPVQAALTQFHDATVDPASYDIVQLHTDPSAILTIGATAAGNPGAGLSLAFTNGGDPLNLLSVVGFIYKGFSWNPAVDGALASVDFGNDRYIDGGDDFINLNLVTFSRALLVQDGQYFLAAILDVGQPRLTWYTSGATGLDALDFVAFDPLTGQTDATRHPDFSAAGGTLGFGFLNRFSINVQGPYNLDALFAYDNIAVQVNPLDAAPVPEPGSLPLLAAALGAWLWRQGSRDRRANEGQRGSPRRPSNDGSSGICGA